MDIEIRPISDHHNQLIHPEQQQACNQYHQLVSNPSENNHHQQQSIRPIESQVRYFYQAIDGPNQQTEAHSTRTQLADSEQSSSTLTTAASAIVGKSVVEAVESHCWFSSKNRQSNNEYSHQVDHQPLSCAGATHDNHSSTANISQLQPLPNSFAALPAPAPPPVRPHFVTPVPRVQQQTSVTSYANEIPNEFYQNSNNQTATDYNYSLHQRNAWHLSPCGDSQFATQQYYNYNYYEGQQQQQQQQLYQQQYQINNLIQDQHVDKQHNYYNNSFHPNHHAIDEQLYDTPSNFLYSDRYSSGSTITETTFQQANGSASQQTRQQPSVDERSSYLTRQHTGGIHELKPATSDWSINQVKSSPSNHIQTSVCSTGASNQITQSWTPSAKEQLSGTQDTTKKVTVVVGKTNLNKVGSIGATIQRTNQCGVCGRNYARPSTLKTHLRTHTNERPFKCNVCCKTFSQAANLTAHQRVHTGERPFSCPICGRQFSQSSSVITHSRTHSGERPYRCNMCSRTFSDSSTLTKHCRIHSGEKPYQCDYCPLNFSQSGNLSRHLKLHLMNGSNSNNRNNGSADGTGGCCASSTTSSTSSTSSSNQSTVLPSQASNEFNSCPERGTESSSMLAA